VGPGTYSHPTPLVTKVANQAPVGRRGIFGTSAERIKAHPEKHSEGFPLHARDGTYGDPGSYRQRKALCKKGKWGSSLVSKSKRFASEAPVGDPIIDWHPTPSPDSYDPTHVPSYRSPFRKGRTAHLSFGSSKDRFGASDHFAGQPCKPLPGPGQYTPGYGFRDTHIGGAPSSTEHRKLQPGLEHGGADSERVIGPSQGHRRHQSIPGRGRGSPDIAGPGSYQVRGSLVRRTFNNSAQDHAKRTIHHPSSDSQDPVQELSQTLSVSSSASWTGGAGGGQAATKARKLRTASDPSARGRKTQIALSNSTRALEGLTTQRVAMSPRGRTLLGETLIGADITQILDVASTPTADPEVVV